MPDRLPIIHWNDIYLRRSGHFLVIPQAEIVALSFTEYMGLIDAMKEAIYLSGFLKELGLDALTNITIFNNNQGAEEVARNPVYYGRSKHIDIRYHFVREALNH